MGMEIRSKTWYVGPCRSWEKICLAFIGPSKAGFFGLALPEPCSSFHFWPRWTNSQGLLPLSSLEEAMAPPSLRSTPDRNSSKQNTTRKWYTDIGDSGGLNRRKLYIKTKSQEETGTETSSGVLSHLGGMARGGPVTPMCEEHTNSFSCPFSSHDFSYLVKIVKKLKEELFAKLLWLELLPIRKWTLQVPAICLGWILPEKLFQ
jgi:hypothetical protein